MALVQHCIEILLFLVSTSLAAMCPSDWQRYGETCIFIINRQLEWTQANDTCAAHHGTMVVPRSVMQQRFIWKKYMAFFNDQPPTSLWIGCNDMEQEGAWHPCPTGVDPSGYENWSDGEPSDSDPQNNCAVLDKDQDGQWTDFNCASRCFALCERPADTSSTPTYCLHTGPDGRITSRCLLGHVVKELPADGVVSCGKACRLEPRCRSFNLLDHGGLGENMTCQLNNVASGDVRDFKLVEIEDCYMFDI